MSRVFGWLAAAAALVVLGAVIAFVVLHRETGRAATTAVEDPLTADSAESVARTLIGGTLRRNELFAQLLTRLGVNEARIAAAQAALESAGFDFRNMHPGDSVTVVCEDSVRALLSYHLDMATRYVVLFGQDSVRAEIVTEPVETVRAALRAAVDGSLWQSMTNAGASPQLVESFAEVLRNSFDFRSRRVRCG